MRLLFLGLLVSLLPAVLATGPQTDIVGVPPLNFTADPAAVAADIAALPRRDDPGRRNMLLVIALQALVDHNLVFTPGLGAGECLVPAADLEYYRDVSCFPFTTVGPHPVNTVPAPHLRAFFVYGDDDRAAVLADPPRLRLGPHGLLPRAGELGLGADGHPSEIQFVAGDVRASENVFLTAIHTVFARWHNSLAARLGSFDSARAALTRDVDVIVFHELLPALIGPYADCTGVPQIDEVDKTFVGAFLRIHSMINGRVIDHLRRHGVTRLADTFFDPSLLERAGGDLVPFRVSLYKTPALADALAMEDDLNRLLFHRQNGPALSLAVANLRRSTDLGLPDFAAARAAVGLAPYAAYTDFVDDPHVLAFLDRHFPGGPTACPVWICARAERPAPESALGETASVWFRRQLCGLRREPPSHPEPPANLATIICATSGACTLGDSPYTLTASSAAGLALGVVAGAFAVLLLCT